MSKSLKQFISSIPRHSSIYVTTSMDILERIHEVMEEKNISQKDLAAKMRVSEPYISKLIFGVQNYSIKTLARLEDALGEKIITVLCKRNSKPS